MQCTERHAQARTRGDVPARETQLTWDFLQRYDESWIWRCADRHEVTESARNFAALDECIADAVRHGYIASAERTRSGHRAVSDQAGNAARRDNAGRLRPARK
jgi:hypothetical protein